MTMRNAIGLVVNVTVVSAAAAAAVVVVNWHSDLSEIWVFNYFVVVFFKIVYPLSGCNKLNWNEKSLFAIVRLLLRERFLCVCLAGCKKCALGQHGAS